MTLWHVTVCVAAAEVGNFWETHVPVVDDEGFPRTDIPIEEVCPFASASPLLLVVRRVPRHQPCMLASGVHVGRLRRGGGGSSSTVDGVENHVHGKCPRQWCWALRVEWEMLLQCFSRLVVLECSSPVLDVLEWSCPCLSPWPPIYPAPPSLSFLPAPPLLLFHCVHQSLADGVGNGVWGWGNGME